MGSELLFQPLHNTRVPQLRPDDEFFLNFQEDHFEESVRTLRELDAVQGHLSFRPAYDTAYLP